MARLVSQREGWTQLRVVPQDAEIRLLNVLANDHSERVKGLVRSKTAFLQRSFLLANDEHDPTRGPIFGGIATFDACTGELLGFGELSAGSKPETKKRVAELLTTASLVERHSVKQLRLKPSHQKVSVLAESKVLVVGSKLLRCKVDTRDRLIEASGRTYEYTSLDWPRDGL